MDSMILTVIGGGSVNWMRGLMRDVYLIDEIKGGEIRLVDPNREHTEAVVEMLKAFNKIRGKEYRIEIYEDRLEALRGADFVLTTFSPGAMDAFWNDLEIPIKYGIRQPVSMTVGPCGISAALRTVPVAYELVEDMERICPGAWLLNVTNPMCAVTKAMNMAARATKVIGMCHGFHEIEQHFDVILGLRKPAGMNTLEFLYQWLPSEGFDYTVAGLNHFIFLTKAEMKGKDLIPQVREYCRTHSIIGKPSSAELKQATTSCDNSSRAAALAVCRSFGYLPINNDRHTVEFLSNLCNLRNGYAMKYGVSKTTVDARRLDKVKQLEEIRRIVAGDAQVDWRPTGEEMTEIMKTIINDSSMTGIVNMPNEGQITNLPMGAVVETMAAITKDGLKPKLSGEMPGALGSLCRLHADINELTVKAALVGSRDILVQVLSIDPMSGSADFDELGALADELLIANREHLPRFFE